MNLDKIDKNSLFTLEKMTEKRPVSCLHCHKEASRMVYDDSAHLKLNLKNTDRSLYDAFMSWGTCSMCGKRRYLVEIAIASERKKNLHLFSDFCWTSTNRNAYWLTFIDKTWELQHNFPLWDVTYYKHGREKVRVPKLSWLDIHFLDFVYDHSKYSEPIEQGRKIAQRLVPLLIAGDLWGKAQD